MLLSTSNKYLFNDNFYESCKIFKDSGLVPNNLIDLSTLKGYNAKREYVLCAIDTFSKFAYCKC